MCISTDKLKFLDIINYLAPGYIYDKYLKAYGCELEKGHFPYEYMDDLLKLDDRILPPQETTVDSRTTAYPARTTLCVR